MRALVTSYKEGLEKLILEHISKARISIYIAVAWFTRTSIKEELLAAKAKNAKLIIEILVDDNEVNKKYFYNSLEVFEKCGIIVRRKADPRFLHIKVMIIDEKITLSGSYNYSKKATRNIENIDVHRNKKLAACNVRFFKKLTDKTYKDEAIMLLYEHPEFARKIISSYYPFTLAEYKQYKDKLNIGNCFTYENGFYDEIQYEPGLIFNPQYASYPIRELEWEFKPPLTKESIMEWTGNRNNMLTIDSYRYYPEWYHAINAELKRNNASLVKIFSRLQEDMYTYSELRAKIMNGVDVIKEDRLWSDNFSLFIDKEILHDILTGLSSLPEVDNRIF